MQKRDGKIEKRERFINKNEGTLWHPRLIYFGIAYSCKPRERKYSISISGRSVWIIVVPISTILP